MSVHMDSWLALLKCPFPLGMPEPLRENDLRTAGFVVDVFGEHLVSGHSEK